MERYLEVLYQRQKNIIEEKKREESRIYCGRENEIAMIEKKLLLPPSQVKPVLNIYGPASIGKSRLLKQFKEREEAKFKPKYVAYVDFFVNYRLRNKCVSFIFKIINDWDTSQSLFTRFRASSIRLKNIIHEKGEKFKDICQHELTRESGTIDNNNIIDVKSFVELTKHHLESEEINFILNYTKKQEELFFNEIELLYQHGSMRRYESIIIIDDLDVCDFSIISLVKKMIQRLGKKVFFMIATCKPLSAMWGEYDPQILSLIECIPLEKLKNEDITNYLLKKEIYDEGLVDTVIDVSSGFPFLMEATVNAIELIRKYNLTISSKELADYFTPPDDLELSNEKAIAEFLLEKINDILTFYDRKLKDVIYGMGVPRYFNEEAVFIIAERDDEKIANFFVDIAGMVFTYHGYKVDVDWKFHDLIREVCLKHISLDPEKKLEIHGRLYQYFKKFDPYEAAYHLYQLKPLEGLEKIIEIFNNSVQSLRIQKAGDILNDFFSYFTEISEDTEIEEKGLIYSSLANMFMNIPSGNYKDNIDKTIVAYNTALKIYDEKKNEVSYGSILKKLGEAYTHLYDASSDKTAGEKYLSDSIDYYQKALKIFSREVFPEEYADLNYRIGLVLGKFINSPNGYFNNALDYLEKSLKVYSEKNLKINIATIKNETGNIYLKIAEKENKDVNLSKALKLYHDALDIYKEKNIIPKIAEMWKKIGITHYKFEQNKAQNLNLAIESLNKALTIFSKEKYPFHFMEIKKYLGMSYYYLRTGDSSINTEKALSIFKEAYELVDRKKNPEDYAELNIYLGNTYGRLRLGDRIQNLEKALSFYSQAMEIYNKVQYPFKYAEVLNNQGMVYLELPTGNHKDNIKKAIDLFTEVLQIRNETNSPDDYAETLMNIGSAYQELMTEGEENAKDALSAYMTALSIYKRDKYPIDFAMITNNMGNIYEKIAISAYRNNDSIQLKNYICRSMNCYADALGVIDKKNHPQFFEIISKNLDKIKKIVEKLKISC
ncbi:ATP-binding protein [Candidatus Desantisbacteria bacterium]|nr:ATP-binding protein [Candidatus Desantisbacteria bacterium]